MKKIIIFFLLFIPVLPNLANAEGFKYTDQQDHYSFTLPEGWGKISKATLDKATQKLASPTGGNLINYEVGFTPDNTSNLEYPYILVQEHKVNTPSYEQISKIISSDEFSKKAEKAIDKSTNDRYKELISNASMEDPYFDKERNIIFTNMEMDVGQVGQVKGLIAMFLGKESIVQLNFYSLKSEYSQNLAIFNQIIDSFEYQPGYKYDKEEVKKNNSSNIFEGAIEKGLIGLIVGALMGAILLPFRLSSRKKEDNEEEDEKSGEDQQESKEKLEQNKGNGKNEDKKMQDMEDQFSELNSMRMKNLITDEEYLAQRKKLQKELNNKKKEKRKMK